jgi:DNA-binding response OmpR family regulator
MRSGQFLVFHLLNFLLEGISKQEKLMKILIVDDDPDIVENLILTFKVSWPDSEVLDSSLGIKSINIVETEQPDIVILDLGLPDISGFEVLKQIRLFSDVPIIVLTVRSEEGSVIKAFNLGANEFIVKPFRQMELLSRINNVFKRESIYYKSTTLNLGPMIFDFLSNTIKSGNKTIRLTPIESIILHSLLENQGHKMTSYELIRSVWGENNCEYNDALRVHIRHLRQKIESNPSKPHYIITAPGMVIIFPKQIK